MLYYHAKTMDEYYVFKKLSKFELHVAFYNIA